MDLTHLPHPSQKNMAVHITPAAERSLRSGHPWLYENSIRDMSHAGKTGDIAVIFDKKRRFLAVGLYDPTSPVRVKILQHRTSATIGPDFFHDKLQQAMKLRAILSDEDTTGYRLVHGENDGLPALIIDRYADVLVLKLYSTAWFPHLRDVLAALKDLHPNKTIILRLSRLAQNGETFGLSDGMVLHGDLKSSQVRFCENGLSFVADVVHGHKTGFFFDQRENRARVRDLSQGRDVLDVFSYNGGFSLYAAAGGAQSVISVDISTPALVDAQKLFALNQDNPQVAACQHEIMAVDAFEALENFAVNGRKFGLVIVDPPSFANKESQIEAALRAYHKLADLAVQVVKENSILVMASCSSRVSPDDFFNTVHHAATHAGHSLQEIERTSHAIDHPLLNTFPEGRYLKCLYAKVT